MVATPNIKDLQFAFDVGHSSIGWAVLQVTSRDSAPTLLGTGAVTFGADDCLASKRRAYRRQRRHVRSTRQRVARLEKFLAHLGVISAADLQAKHRQSGGHSAPWMLAARVLSSDGATERLLTWMQLWDVIRWYGHNRGYDGNRRWSSEDAATSDGTDAKADTEKEQTAIALMDEHHTQTMAETFVRVLGLDVDGDKQSSRVRFKAKSAAFPRATVEREFIRILQAHRGHLPHLDDPFIALLTARTLTKPQRTYLTTIGIPLPARYEGGLLFGQLVPRFDNRIISTCPITGEKVPTRNCPEFLRFRWAMQLANIRVGELAAKDLRPLISAERHTVNDLMRSEGHLTLKGLKDAIRALPGITRDNLDTLLMHPDAKDALLLDPVTQLTRSDQLKTFWPTLAPRVHKRARDAWQRGKTLKLVDLRNLSEKLGEPTAAFDEAITARLDKANTSKRKKDVGLTRDSLLAETLCVRKLSGRGAYARSLLARAHEEVLQGKHPKEAGGCLFLNEKKRHEQLTRRIEDQTNNHLVRHRLLILERLLRDLIADPLFATGDHKRVGRLTIEVNRDLREMSGKTAKQIEQDLGLRLSNHDKVSKKLEAAFAEQTFNGTKVAISAGLIRKARIAEDLGWVCPYTGMEFEPIHLVSHVVDKDHIIPRSQRPSDSLDSLVITYSEINKWKGNRTGWQFVQEEQGKPVPGRANLFIRPLTKYSAWVEALESFKGHDDDKRRKKNRRALLLLPKYEDKAKTFLPGDLTQTSQLVRLGAQLLAKHFIDLAEPPPVISIPGAVTGTVRRSWDLLSCLSLAAPQILEADGSRKTKTDIRDITHLHHALDACVLAYTSLLLPRDGGLWELMIKRNPNESEKAQLRATGYFDFDAQGRFGLRDLPPDWKNQIRLRLAEKRVVQHAPADKGGLRVEENTRGVEKIEDGRVYLRQQSRDIKTGEIKIKHSDETVDKVVGLSPKNGTGKLKPQKGVRIITDNFGVALLDHAPEGQEKFAIIPWHKVWHRLGELTKRNGGKHPKILRIGMLIAVPRGSRKGTWRVISTKKSLAYGYSLDLAEPDGLKLAKGNAPIEKLINDGMVILQTNLTGIPVAPRNSEVTPA